MPPKPAPSKSSKRKKTSASSDGNKRPQTAAVKMDEQLHPADLKRRERVMEVTRERYEQEVKDAFTHLDKLCPGMGSKRILSKQDKMQALSKWCQEYTNDNFPNIGAVTYAVPQFFIGNHSLKRDKDSPLLVNKQESDVRGDNAHSKVGRGLRLLSEEMEKNGEHTMFIIENFLSEQVLIWPDATSEARESSCLLQKDLQKQYPHLFANTKSARYYSRRDLPQDSRATRGETDTVILHETKGVIVIEVKSFGTHEAHKGIIIKTKAVTQLEGDENVFHNLFEHEEQLKTLNVSKVLALPNLTEKEAKTRCEISEKDGVNLLCKDNLFDDDMDKAEAEYSLQKLRDWWSKLPDNPISLESIKDIVARFIGTFSKPRDLDHQTERTHVRTIADAIQLAGSMFKTRGLNLPEEQKTDVTLTGDEYKKTHVQGPPGSGRTTMLICKAMTFLEEGADNATSRYVVVLDMYRGLKGRPIGIHIKNDIRDAEKNAFDDRVHRLPIDVLDDQKSFVQQVKDLFSGHKPKWKYVLFIIDEMLALGYWPDIFKAFKNEFKDSQVWCADGLIAQELGDAPEFKHLQLEHIYRLPGSVQKVLYHADWDEKRKQQYCSDVGVKQGDKPSASTHQAVQPKKPRASEAGKSGEKQPGKSSAGPTPRLNVCTHGPTAVCIKHQHCANKALLDCVQCAEELIDLLMNKMKLVENKTHSSPKKSVVGEKAQAATSQAKPDEGHGQAASSDMEVDEEDNPGAVAGPSVFLPCSIVIVFSIPSNLYQASTQGSDHVEINKEDYEYYVAKLNNSQLISTLRKALPVQLFPTGPGQGQNQNPDCPDNWNKVLLSWVDIFQGLERDVVIFLPGETAFQTEELACSSLQVPDMSVINLRDPPSPRREKKSPASSPRSKSGFSRSQDPQPSKPTETEVTGRKTGKRPAAAAAAAAAASIHERKIPEPGLTLGTSQIPVSSRTRGAVGTSSQDTTAAAAVATEKGMSSYYWRVRDIQRYTDWDKTSLMFAATRCTSQLIMLVP